MSDRILGNDHFQLVTDTEKSKLEKEETKNCLMLALLLVEWHISICNMAGQMSQIICSMCTYVIYM